MKIKTSLLLLMSLSHVLFSQQIFEAKEVVNICSKGIYQASEMRANYFPGEDRSTMCIPKSNGVPNSYWYAWKIEHAGTIEFLLSPDNPSDDIDFELYLNLEEDMNMVRCMASGPNIGALTADNCLGVTGMMSEFSQIKESLGCHPDKTNFTSPAYASKGQIYLLRIINFSSERGFEFELSGTAELQTGENIDIAQDLENEKLFHFEAVAENLNSIEQVSWNFGIDARPSKSASKNPPIVVYESPGTKEITLEAWDKKGCFSQKNLAIVVNDNQSYAVTKDELQVFPNPFMNNVNIGIPDFGIGAEQSLSLWSTNGEMIYEKIVSANLETFDFSELPAGTYLVKLQTEKTTFTTELIKVNNQGN